MPNIPEIKSGQNALKESTEMGERGMEMNKIKTGITGKCTASLQWLEGLRIEE